MSKQEFQRRREDIKNQMRQFMLHLHQKAQSGDISSEKAKAAAEKVRAEAAKKYVHRTAYSVLFDS